MIGSSAGDDLCNRGAERLRPATGGVPQLLGELRRMATVSLHGFGDECACVVQAIDAEREITDCPDRRRQPQTVKPQTGRKVAGSAYPHWTARNHAGLVGDRQEDSPQIKAYLPLACHGVRRNDSMKPVLPQRRSAREHRAGPAVYERRGEPVGCGRFLPGAVDPGHERNPQAALELPADVIVGETAAAGIDARNHARQRGGVRQRHSSSVSPSSTMPAPPAESVDGDAPIHNDDDLGENSAMAPNLPRSSPAATPCRGRP
jgi:hypothetical protein